MSCIDDDATAHQNILVPTYVPRFTIEGVPEEPHLQGTYPPQGGTELSTPLWGAIVHETFVSDYRLITSVLFLS